jgi:hypothetical protein
MKEDTVFTIAVLWMALSVLVQSGISHRCVTCVQSINAYFRYGTLHKYGESASARYCVACRLLVLHLFATILE